MNYLTRIRTNTSTHVRRLFSPRSRARFKARLQMLEEFMRYPRFISVLSRQRSPRTDLNVVRICPRMKGRRIMRTAPRSRIWKPLCKRKQPPYEEQKTERPLQNRPPEHAAAEDKKQVRPYHMAAVRAESPERLYCIYRKRHKINAFQYSDDKPAQQVNRYFKYHFSSSFMPRSMPTV